jgi:hypothetical protein
METNNSLARRMESSLEASLTDLAKAAEVIMLLVDTSGSMSGSPVENLRKVVEEINPRAAGIPMIAFGGPYDAQVRFVDSVPEPDGGTPLHIAIPMAKEYGANRVVVISDGCPDLREQCIIEAQNFGGRIDVVYIGHTGDAGEFFLRQLAELTGGTCGAHDIGRTKELAGTVMGVLEGDVDPNAKVIIAGDDGAQVSDIDAPDDDDEPEEDDDEEEDDDDSDDDDDEDEDDEE